MVGGWKRFHPYTQEEKNVVKSVVDKKLSVDKEKLSPYIGGVVLSFITFVILF